MEQATMTSAASMSSAQIEALLRQLRAKGSDSDVALHTLRDYIMKQAHFEHWEKMLKKYKRDGFYWIESWIAPYHHNKQHVCLHSNNPEKETCTNSHCSWSHCCLICEGKHNVYARKSDGSYRCVFMARLLAGMQRLGITFEDVEQIVQHVRNPPSASVAAKPRSTVQLPSGLSPPSQSHTVQSIPISSATSAAFNRLSLSIPAPVAQSAARTNMPAVGASPPFSLFAPANAQYMHAEAALAPVLQDQDELYQLLARAFGGMQSSKVLAIHAKLLEEEVDVNVLGSLTRENFSELGIKLGSEVRIRKALSSADHGAPPAY